MTVKEIEYLLKAELGSHELDYLAETCEQSSQSSIDFLLQNIRREKN